MSEKRVREVQFCALGSSRNRRRAYAVENLAGALKTETIRHKLSVAREFKMKIPDNTSTALQCWTACINWLAATESTWTTFGCGSAK